MSNRPLLNVLIRGHIRSSFNEEKLLNFFCNINSKFDVNFYAHTWNAIQNSLSWRPVGEVNDVVSEKTILDYVKGRIKFKWIGVSDDKLIRHHGNIEGKIGMTPCPVLGWKNMYWGMMEGAKAVSKSSHKDTPTLQLRFDLFCNPFSPDMQEVLDFLDRDYEVMLTGSEEDERIRFLRMHCFFGVDNIYMSRAEDLLRFISYMYYDMDRILYIHRGTMAQEHIAFHERRSFFDWVLPGEPVYDGVAP